MKKLQCVFTDLDASLLNTDKQISSLDLATIKQLKAMGIPVFAVTGRAHSFAKQVVEDMGFDYPVCACNGGHIYDYLTGETLFAQLIDRQTLIEVYDYLISENIDFILYTKEKSIFSGIDTKRCRRWKDLNSTLRPENRITFSYITDPDFSIEGCEAIKLLLGYVTKEQSDAFEARFGPGRTLSMAYSGAGLFDVNAYGVNKGVGVKFLAEHYGLSLENALALGDHFNDVDMLKCCGCSATPENGQAEVKAVAKFVTTDNNNSPLTNAVKHFFPGLLGD